MAEMTDDVKILLGDPKKALLRMSLPLLIALVVGQLNSFIDMFWCSSLGMDALAAVGIVSSFCFLLNGIGNGLGMGMSVAMAKRIGAGQKDVAGRIAAQGIVLILTISLVVSPLFLLFADPMISLIGGDVAHAESMAYAYPFLMSAFIMFAHGVFGGLLRAEGAAKRSMTIMLLSVALNMVLDPLFAFTFGMGIAGLAWATVLSTAIAIVPAIYWYFIGRTTYIDVRFNGFRFDGTLIKEFLRTGVPKTVELNIMSAINLALVYFLVVCGGLVGVALYNTTWKYVNLLMIPSQALGGGLVPMGAAAFGSGDMRKVREGYNHSLMLALAITIAGSFVLAIFSEQFAFVFTSSGSAEGLREEMAHAVLLFSLFIPFYAWINISSSLLQAIYMADRSMYSTLVRNILLIAVFWYTSSIDLEAMWWGLILCEIFGGLLMGTLAEMGLRRRTVALAKGGASPVT